MRTIKEICDRPSKALRAVAEGLENLPKTGKFKVSMNTFGEVRNGVCFGCAATACLLTLTRALDRVDENFDYLEARIKTYDVDVWEFEHVIDTCRTMKIFWLLEYYRIDNAKELENSFREELHEKTALRGGIDTRRWKEKHRFWTFAAEWLEARGL